MCLNHDSLYNFCKIKIVHRNFDNSIYVWSVSVEIMVSHVDFAKAIYLAFCKIRIVHRNFDKPTTIPNTCFLFLWIIAKIQWNYEQKETR